MKRPLNFPEFSSQIKLSIIILTAVSVKHFLEINIKTHGSH